MLAMKATSKISPSSAPHLAVSTGSNSRAITISAIGSRMPPARVIDSGTPNDRMAAWEPFEVKEFGDPRNEKHRRQDQASGK